MPWFVAHEPFFIIVCFTLMHYNFTWAAAVLSLANGDLNWTAFDFLFMKYPARWSETRRGQLPTAAKALGETLLGIRPLTAAYAGAKSWLTYEWGIPTTANANSLYLFCISAPFWGAYAGAPVGEDRQRKLNTFWGLFSMPDPDYPDFIFPKTIGYPIVIYFKSLKAAIVI